MQEFRHTVLDELFFPFMVWRPDTEMSDQPSTIVEVSPVLNILTQ